MKIKQYRPSFFEGFTDEVNSFTTKEELLSIPWVKEFTKAEGSDVFTGFSMSGSHLFACYNYNTSNQPFNLCVGVFMDKESYEAAMEWIGKIPGYEYVMKNGDVVIVTSICGPTIEVAVNGDMNNIQTKTQDWLNENFSFNRSPRVTFKGKDI